MLRSKPCLVALAFVATLSASSAALAAGPLTVAGENPPPPPPAPAQTALPQSSSPSSPADTAAADRPEKVRDKVEFGGWFGLLSGVAIDDGKEGGFLVRPALEIGANIGVGDVGIFVGGLPLGIEVVEFGHKTSVAYPAMTVIGVHDDTWLVQIAGGASIAADDDYGDIVDDEKSLPSPRGEVRGGFRFFEEGLMELTAHAG
ncbi:MAG: hypothetical protein HOV80_06615, partial [Polyangiaceae bacterium]|nr:hypothetical protein [Polyangiaceae bacterium]